MTFLGQHCSGFGSAITPPPHPVLPCFPPRFLEFLTVFALAIHFQGIILHVSPSRYLFNNILLRELYIELNEDLSRAFSNEVKTTISFVKGIVGIII